VKFPLGILSFVATIALMSTSISMALAPLSTLIPPLEMNIGPWEVDSPFEAAPLALIGFPLFFISLHLLNGLAWTHSKLARICLKRLPAN
jgi:hypothetical protein